MKRSDLDDPSELQTSSPYVASSYETRNTSDIDGTVSLESGQSRPSFGVANSGVEHVPGNFVNNTFVPTHVSQGKIVNVCDF